jgi:hypothetical protein
MSLRFKSVENGILHNRVYASSQAANAVIASAQSIEVVAASI